MSSLAFLKIFDNIRLAEENCCFKVKIIDADNIQISKENSTVLWSFILSEQKQQGPENSIKILYTLSNFIHGEYGAFDDKITFTSNQKPEIYHTEEYKAEYYAWLQRLIENFIFKDPYFYFHFIAVGKNLFTFTQKKYNQLEMRFVLHFSFNNSDFILDRFNGSRDYELGFDPLSITTKKNHENLFSFKMPDVITEEILNPIIQKAVTKILEYSDKLNIETTEKKANKKIEREQRQQSLLRAENQQKFIKEMNERLPELNLVSSEKGRLSISFNQSLFTDQSINKLLEAVRELEKKT